MAEKIPVHCCSCPVTLKLCAIKFNEASGVGSVAVSKHIITKACHATPWDILPYRCQLPKLDHSKRVIHQAWNVKDKLNCLQQAGNVKDNLNCHDDVSPETGTLSKYLKGFASVMANIVSSIFVISSFSIINLMDDSGHLFPSPDNCYSIGFDTVHATTYLGFLLVLKITFTYNL